MIDPGALFTVKVGLLDCVAAQLAATAAGPPDRRCVYPGGEVAWDDCECGLLAVNHTNLYPSRTFPEPTREPPFRCDPPWWVATLVVTLVRCVGTGEADRAPSCEELDAATLTQDVDVEAMQRGVACCFSTRQPPWLIGDHLPVGPDGACVGSQLTVLAAFGNCPVEC